MEILSIAWAFFKVGIVSFGGGWSIVGLIKHEVVPRWLDDEGFRSLVAIAQSTPGPIALNAATLVGWERGGILGALLATGSVLAFPVLAVASAGFIASRLAARGRGLDQGALDEALRTATLAMMLMTLWTLRPASLDPLVLGLALASFALAAFTKLSPLWAILGAGAAKAAWDLLAGL
ncbi:MAG TPA: chromate transporter [Spirochaetales bacterium]|nr:chromate transporter [Spirochaetales bacterium]HRY55942.1 chromate transporter [Spirochaetia bacterium]